MIKINENFKRDLSIEVDKILSYKVPGELDKKVDAFNKKIESEFKKSESLPYAERMVVRDRYLEGVTDLNGLEDCRDQLMQDVEQMRSFEYEMAIYLTSVQRKALHEKIEFLFREVLGSLYGRGGIGGAPHGAANEMCYGYNRLARITVDVKPDAAKLHDYMADKARHEAIWQKAYKVIYPKHGQDDSHKHRVDNPQAEAVIEECRSAINKLEENYKDYIDQLSDSTHKWSEVEISVDDYYGWSFTVFKSPNGSWLSECISDGDPDILTVDGMRSRVQDFPTGTLRLEESGELRDFTVFTDGHLVLKLMVIAAEDCSDKEEMSVPFNSVAEEREWFQKKIKSRYAY